jgi:glucose dehydrogenase
MKTQAPFPSAPGWPARVLGVVLLLIGLVLAVGGIQLAVLGGSVYYVLAGVGLIVAGVLMARRSLAGAWVYLGVFVATLVWALWESGAGADWPAYGGTYAGQRYSPLAQITPDNVGKLKRAWMIHTGDLPSETAARASTGPRTPR